jgi:ankyrin repeat protein
MECVRVLLGAQANLISADSNGASPLHLAVLNGHRECAALLIEKGSLVNAQDDRYAPRVSLLCHSQDLLTLESCVVARVGG